MQKNQNIHDFAAGAGCFQRRKQANNMTDTDISWDTSSKLILKES